MALEHVGSVMELAESGTCQTTAGAPRAKVQANVTRVEVRVGILAKNVEVQGFSCIGCTIS